MSYLLALDTATTTASVAVYHPHTATIAAELTWAARRRQTQDLAVTVGQVLQLAHVAMEQITGLAVTTGPGSFTGVRIAISLAKGIGLGLEETPWAVGVPTLAVVAWPWLRAAGPTGPQIVACLAAGRSRFNWAHFDPANPFWMPTAADHGAGDGQAFRQMLQNRQEPCWVTGELPSELAAAVHELPWVTLVEPQGSLRRAGHLAQIAAGLQASGLGRSIDQIQPLYLAQPS